MGETSKSLNLDNHISNGFLKITVKSNAKKTRIVGVDENKNALKVEVAAPPEDNRANLEIIKFFTRETKKTVKIKKGLTSKEKLLFFN